MPGSFPRGISSSDSENTPPEVRAAMLHSAGFAEHRWREISLSFHYNRPHARLSSHEQVPRKRARYARQVSSVSKFAVLLHRLPGVFFHDAPILHVGPLTASRDSHSLSWTTYLKCFGHYAMGPHVTRRNSRSSRATCFASRPLISSIQIDVSAKITSVLSSGRVFGGLIETDPRAFWRGHPPTNPARRTVADSRFS